jgi:molybdopterin-guanine dinucleotide biosynthesis protein A
MTHERERLDAMILAGASRGALDPLLEGTGVNKKALLPILGKPMVAYVEAALRASGRVNRIVVIGLDPEDAVDFSGPVERIASQGGIIQNVLAAMAYLRDTGSVSPYFLEVSSDIPLLTGDIVSRFVDACQAKGGDLIYSVVAKHHIEKLFSGSKRSYAHVRDGYFAGGDMFMVRADMPASKAKIFEELAAERKNALKMARILGPGLLISVVFRRLTLASLECRVSKILGLDGRVINAPDPEIAMDVDKPHQLEMVTRYMERIRK